MNPQKKMKRAWVILLSFIVLLVSCQLTALASDDEGNSNVDATAEVEETTGGETSSGEATGGETTGGETTGGETTGGEATGGGTSSGETSGGETSGGETSGGETSGGEASGGDEVAGGITAEDVSVLKGDTSFHLLDGVKAKHETGAALTVEVTDDGGFDVNVTGDYTVAYEAGSGAYTAARTVTVFEFDYDPQPASAQEVRQIINTYMSGLSIAETEEDIPTLPKWREAVDAGWLPAYWTQVPLTDETTSAPYWTLQMSIIASPLALMGDVSVNFNSFPSTFRTYTSATGAAISYLELNITINIAQNNVTNAEVVIPLDWETGHNNVPGSIGSELFTPYDCVYGSGNYTAPAGGGSILTSTDLAAATVLDSVRYDTGSPGELVVKLKDNVTVGTSESIVFRFAYNPVYNQTATRVAPGTKLWDNVKAQVRDSVSSAVQNTYSGGAIYTSANNPANLKPTSLSRMTPNTTTVQAGSVATLRLNQRNDYYYQHGQLYPSTLTLRFPNTITTFTGASGYTITSDAIYTYLTRAFTNDTSVGGWPTVDTASNKDTGSWIQSDISFTVPDTLAVPSTVLVEIFYDYRLAGESTPRQSTALPLSYTVTAAQPYAPFIYPTHNSGWSTNSKSVCGLGILNVSTTDIHVAGYGYTNLSSTKNTGTDSLKHVNLTLSNSTSGTGVLNYNKITLYASRESALATYTNYYYYFILSNGLSSSTQTANQIATFTTSSTTSQYHTLTLPSLLMGQYIKDVVIIPFGNDPAPSGTQDGDLLGKNAFHLQYTIKGWGGTWPDDAPGVGGTAMAAYNEVPASWTMTYARDAAGTLPDLSTGPHYYRISATTSGGTITVPHVYARDAVYAGAQLVNTNGGAASPGGTLDYKIEGYVHPGYSFTTWNAPVIVLKITKDLTLDPANGGYGNYTLTNTGGGTHAMTYTALGTDGTHNYYRLAAPPGYSAAQAAGLRFTIPIRFTVSPTASAGTNIPIPLAQVVVASGGTSPYQQVVNPDGYSGVTHSGETLSNYGFNAGEQFYFMGTDPFPTTISFSNDPYTISYNIATLPGTAIFSIANDPVGGMGAWDTANLITGAENGETVKVKLTVTNNSNTPLTNFALYDILPLGGYNPDTVSSNPQYNCTGAVAFLNVYPDPATTPNGTERTYYYAGGAVPALNTIQSINPSGPGWSTSPTGAEAFYFDYGTNQVPAGGKIEIILEFQVPASGWQSVFNMFQYMYKTSGSSSYTDVNSQIHGFTTEKVTIVYEGNQGTGSTTPDTSLMPPDERLLYGFGRQSNVTGAAPNRVGYTFTGWNTAANGTGGTFAAGALIDADTVFVQFLGSDSSVPFALYAQRQAKKYTLTFDKNGGTTEATPASKTVTFDQPIGYIPQGPDAPSRSGRYAYYTFAGWTWTPNSKTVPDVFSTDMYTIPDHSTVYARWLRIPTEPNGGIYEGPDMDRIEYTPWDLNGEEAITDLDDGDENTVDYTDTTQWDDPPTFNPETGDSRAVLSVVVCAAGIAAGAVFFTRARKRKQ